MGSLSKYEQETVINFNAGEQNATVYTRDKTVMRKLDAYLFFIFLFYSFLWFFLFCFSLSLFSLGRGREERERKEVQLYTGHSKHFSR